jgi:polar amino acid transport system permease protein
MMTAQEKTAEQTIKAMTQRSLKEKLQSFPWWFVALVLIITSAIITILSIESYREAFNFIRAGISVTITTTLIAFLIALLIGLVTGLARISKNVFFRNVATLYVEFIRGVPMLVLIFFIAFVVIPLAIDGINALGLWLSSTTSGGLSGSMSNLEIKAISMNVRAIIALSFTYGAFLAEIFRAGIQSVDKGQMEAARSQGMSYTQAMYYIILPQAIRNIMPALGNDFIAMLKDSSLVSLLAVRDITQTARLYAGSSFRFDEAYTTLAMMYLIITFVLSLLVKYLERKFSTNER